MKEKGPVTRSWKVWGENGRRQRQSFNESFKYDFAELVSDIYYDGSHDVLEVENYDKTHTHDYSIVRITRNTAEECFKTLQHQITHGVFEIKDRLELLLGYDPGENEIDDDEVSEFYEEAKNLYEAIERLGF